MKKQILNTLGKITKAAEIRDNLSTMSAKEITTTAVESAASIIFKRLIPLFVIVPIATGVIGFMLGKYL